MIVQKAFRFRLYPTEEQQVVLSKQFGHTRFVYNYFLAVRKRAFTEDGESLNYYDCASALAELKDEPAYPWLREASAQALQQSLKDLETAYSNYFRMVREGTLPPQGKKPRKDGMPKGFPKFHSKHDDQSVRFPQDVRTEGELVVLPKVGQVKAIVHRKLEGKINRATVSKTKTGKSFVSLQCAYEAPEPPDRTGDSEIGIDLGLKDFITPTAGEKIQAPKFYRNEERVLKLRGRRLSRKLEAKKQNKLWVNRHKGDHAIKDASARLAATHAKITNRRTDFHHPLSRTLVNEYGLIAFEDLNIKGMLANHHRAKSIDDAGWAQFVNFVTYKQAWAGAEVRPVDRWFPSAKLCSDCGHKNTALKLRDREWVCSNCGTIHDRDTNAAINILQQATRGARESNAVGHMSSRLGHSATEQVREGWQQPSLFEAQRL
jgi:putative transposase